MAAGRPGLENEAARARDTRGVDLTCLMMAVLSTRARLEDGSAAISARPARVPSSSSSIAARGGLRCPRFSAICFGRGGEAPRRRVAAVRSEVGVFC